MAAEDCPRSAIVSHSMGGDVVRHGVWLTDMSEIACGLKGWVREIAQGGE
jgi:hypothetical protein